MSGWMDGWTSGWMDGWMSGWMGGWMSGWMVKEVSAASCHVFGAEKRNGFVRGRCFGCKIVPKADTKSDFLGMLKD